MYEFLFPYPGFCTRGLRISGQSLQKTAAESYVGLQCLLDECLAFIYDMLHQHVSVSFNDHFAMSSTATRSPCYANSHQLI